MTAVIDAAYRLSVLSRVIAASAGGYAVVQIANLAWTLLLPLDRGEALLLSMQSGFVVWTLVILWAFAARTATRAWLGLLLFALPLALVDAFYFFSGALP